MTDLQADSCGICVLLFRSVKCRDLLQERDQDFVEKDSFINSYSKLVFARLKRQGNFRHKEVGSDIAFDLDLFRSSLAFIAQRRVVFHN